MDYKDIISYRKFFFDNLISDIDSFNNVYKSTLFSQGFAKWYLSKFVASDVASAEEMILSEGFAVREGGYLVFVRNGSDLSCFIFNVPDQSNLKSGNSATGLRSDSFSVIGTAEFCQNALESLFASDESAMFSLAINFVTLSDSISLHMKKSLRKIAASIRDGYPERLSSSSASFVAKNDVIKKFSAYMVTKNPDNYNIVGLVRSMIKNIDAFANDVFFRKNEEAKLMFLSMISGVDCAVISEGDDSLMRLLEENIRMYFDDGVLSGRIGYMRRNERMTPDARESNANLIPVVFHIPNRCPQDEDVFFSMMDSSYENLVGKPTSRPVSALDLAYLKERAKRIAISPEMKSFLFEIKSKFDNYNSNSAAGSKYDIPESAWISFSLLFRLSAIFSMRKEVDYSDILILENAPCSLVEDKIGNERWVSKLMKDMLRTCAFFPLHLEVISPLGKDGMLEFDDSVQDENDDFSSGVYVNDMHGSHLDVRITESKVFAKKEDVLYSCEEALQILDKNEARLQNLLKKYSVSLKRANYYTHKYDTDILKAIETRLNENSAEKTRLERFMKVKEDALH